MKKVVVTGAGGKTGQRVFQKLNSRKDKYSVRGIVRTEESKEKLKQAIDGPADIQVLDVTQPDSDMAMSDLFAGYESLIVATSATPKPDFLQVPMFTIKKALKMAASPPVKFPALPEQVDWLGQKRQIDAAVKGQLQHVVIISSMGGTDPNHMLNKLADANILLWKRRAEEYLVESGLKYTILHPGGLKDSDGGEAPILLNVDDIFLGRTSRNISRADVAELCIAALDIPAAWNRSIDCINGTEEEGSVPTSSEDFVKLFTDFSGNCDYSLNRQSVKA